MRYLNILIRDLEDGETTVIMTLDLKSDQIAKELDDLSKYYGVENVKPDEEQTKKILSKIDINKELLKICEK